jgi:hypothetical protein
LYDYAVRRGLVPTAADADNGSVDDG